MAGSPFSLEGKVAIVTGGGVGIGKAIATEFARAGADKDLSLTTFPPSGYKRTKDFFTSEAGEALIRREIPMRCVGEPRELSGAIVFRHPR